MHVECVSHMKMWCAIRNENDCVTCCMKCIRTLWYDRVSHVSSYITCLILHHMPHLCVMCCMKCLRTLWYEMYTCMCNTIWSGIQYEVEYNMKWNTIWNVHVLCHTKCIRACVVRNSPKVRAVVHSHSAFIWKLMLEKCVLHITCTFHISYSIHIYVSHSICILQPKPLTLNPFIFRIAYTCMLHIPYT